MQHPCKQCGKLTTVREGEKHHLCPECNHARRYPSSAAAEAPAATTASSPLSLFGRPQGCIDQLTLVERAAIVTLHGVGWTGRDIAAELRCDEHAVTRWVRRW